MDALDFIERLQTLSQDAIELAIKKNADYANNSDPFANFNTAALSGVSVPRGMLVRMSDKMVRISNLLDRSPKISNESIEDSCTDLSNYALILRIWIEEHHHK